MANRRIAFLVPSLMALAVFVSGCLPSDAEIESDVAMQRRVAYEEWKRQRERGDSSSAKVDGPLALEDAVKLALQYNKSLQYSIQNQEVTRGSRISGYGVILPSATLSGGATRYEHVSGNNNLHSYSLGVSVTQPIAQGGRYPAQLRTDRLNTALTNEKIRLEVQTLIANVATTYYDVLLEQELLNTNRVAVESAEAQLRATTERRRQGTATDYEVLRAQVDVANYRSQMLTNENNINTYRVALLKLMGVSQDSEISFADKLQFLPMRPVFERAFEIASGLRPDLRIAELDARVASEAVRIAQSAWYPAVGASFSQSWNDANGAEAWSRARWNAGLSANWYFGIDNHGNLVSRRAEEIQSQINLLDQQETTLKEIREYMNTLANAEEVVRALEVNQDAAREALRLAEIGYQAGARTELDVTDARKALTDVYGQYYQALANHTKARLNLQVAMGVLGPARLSSGGSMPRGSSVPLANIEEFAVPDYQPHESAPISYIHGYGDDSIASGTAPVAAPQQSPRPARRPQAPASIPAPTPAAVAAPAPAPAAWSAPETVTAAAPAAIASEPDSEALIASVTPGAASAGGISLPPPPPSARQAAYEAPAVAEQPAPAVRESAPLFKVTVREG